MSDSTAKYSDDGRHKWKSAIGGVTFVTLLLLVLFWRTAQSAVSIWVHSGTYNHCFLILPIFFYMLWCDRNQLADLSPRPFPWGGAVISLFAALWFLAYLSGIAEGAQLAVIGILQAVLLSVFGWRVYVRLILPFCYLWLLVPSGEFLVPGLQALTAKTAAALLDLVGIATFREGLTIEVPTGTYLVAPGCAGLNFVLAALATAIAYAELVYRGWGRRLAFVAALLAMAVLGNALRVFLIIAIAHATNNIGDIVDDHLVYGWGFFSFLLLAAMIFGQRFRQDDPSLQPVRPLPAIRPAAMSIPGAVLVAAVLVAAAPAAAPFGWPDIQKSASPPPALSCGPFDAAPPDPAWPRTVAATDVLASLDCQKDGHHVHFAVAVLDRPVRQGKLIGLDRKVAGDEDWTVVGRSVGSTELRRHPVPVQAVVETRGNRRRLVWSFFWTKGSWQKPGLDTAVADIGAELGGHRRAVLVMAATGLEDDEAAAARLLTEFLGGQPLEQLASGDPSRG